MQLLGTMTIIAPLTHLACGKRLYHASKRHSVERWVFRLLGTQSIICKWFHGLLYFHSPKSPLAEG